MNVTPKKIFWSAILIVGSLLLGMVTTGLVEALGHWLFPLPAGVDATSMESIKANLDKFAPGHFVSVLAAFGLGAFAGTALASYMAPCCPRVHCAIVGGVLMLLGLANVFAFPHPTWVVVTAVLLYPVSAILGLLAGTQPLPGLYEGWTKEIYGRF
jgi:hypothetical protein